MRGFGRIRAAGLLLLLAAGLVLPLKAEAARKEETIYAGNPYVTMSPDGRAFTLGLGRKGTAGLDNERFRGMKVEIHGRKETEPAPEGMHYYVGKVEGEVPVGYWELVHPRSFCIHGGDHTWYGLDRMGAIPRICGKTYFPGWLPYCAYCGKQIGGGLFYMDPDMARSLTYLESGSEYSHYFYLCPHSMTLEQTIPTDHSCFLLSENRYRVQYHSGAEDAEGYMQRDDFYHDNAGEYEGRSVTPLPALSENRYQRVGYIFAGWTTRPGGDVVFGDRQDWMTVQEEMAAEKLENDSQLDLYAVWEPAESSLLVKTDGGVFQGKTGDSLFTRGYGTELLLENVTYPDYQVTLDGRGAGEFSVKVLKSRRSFVEWKKGTPFLGSYDAKKGAYTFSSPKAGSRDVLTAAWTAEAVVLPAVTRDGYAFDGWYETGKGTSVYAGGAGDHYVPRGDVTLRAEWTEVALKLDSLPVYDRNVNSGRGAADLSWALAKDRTDVSYKLYRQKEGEGRKIIHSAGEITGDVTVAKTFGNSGAAETYRVPSTGRYDITLTGASGGSHGSNKGGAGGKVSLTLWLTQGQILKMEPGKTGQNGTADSPATGGGATRLYVGNGTGAFELLAVAGGGGGANERYDGGAGGASGALRASGGAGEGRQLPTSRQESTSLRKIYASGGGDGYVGGLAGRVTYKGHVHSRAVCGYHTHTGSEESGGGCYGTRIRTPHVHDETCGKQRVEYCGASMVMDEHGHYVKGFCPNCGRDESGGCTSPDGKCVKYDRYTCDSSDRITYERNCGLQEGWQCGKDGNHLELVTALSETYPSGGGSNYVSGTAPAGCYILSKQYNAAANFGVSVGGGKVTLNSKTTGYRTDRALKGVTASDEAAPGQIRDLRVESAGKGRLSISWEEPEDRGTEYRFLAECYEIRSGRLLAVSNETGHRMVTGIAGYYVRTDSDPETVVTAGNGKMQTGKSLLVSAREDRRIYVHIAAADRAGNMGPTVHIPVDPMEKAVLWDVVTRQILVREDEHVWNAGKGICYFRGDGESPVAVILEGDLQGPARTSYQIRSLTLEEEESAAGQVTILPYGDTGTREASYDGSRLEFAATGKTLLSRSGSSSAQRLNFARSARVTAEFLPAKMEEGQSLWVYPSATARELTSGEETLSDAQSDRTHGIRLVADVTSPTLYGISEAAAIGQTIDRGKIASAIVTFTAEDSGSGVKESEFYATITNRDNLVTRRFDPVNGTIRVDLASPDDYLFSGDFELTVHAEDRVGNVSEETISFAEFDLVTSVSRILEPLDGVTTFKRGESGILHITATGYADSVEVTFPQGLTAADPELDHVFDYSSAPDFEKHEDYVFMIPLYPLMEEKDSFEISVTARKGDLILTSHPRIHVLELDGSVLDELVTSLR